MTEPRRRVTGPGSPHALLHRDSNEVSERDGLMATVIGRKAELAKLAKLEDKWSFYRSTCQFRLGYFSFLVMMVIVMFSFTFLMEIFFAIFLPSARADANFTVRSLFLLGVLPFALILLSYLFEESSRLFFDAINKSEGSLANFRLSITVVIHYLRHWEEMPEDRLHQEYLSQYQSVDSDAEAWKRLVSSIRRIFVADDPFDDKNKEEEDKKRTELERSFTRAHDAVHVRHDKVVDEQAADAHDRWKKAIGAAHTAAIFTKTDFDGPPLDFSTLILVDLICPVVFEVTTLWNFGTTLLSTLSPMQAFLAYIQAGFYTLVFYLVLWVVCHFWSARNQKMREFVSNYRRRRRNLERALQEMENEKKSEQLWLVDIGFRAYEFLQSLVYTTVSDVVNFVKRCQRSGRRPDPERLPLTQADRQEAVEEAIAAVTTDANETTDAIDGKFKLQELQESFQAWNPWTKFSYNRRLAILCPLVFVSAIISFGAFYLGWILMGFSLILLASAIQGKFPQIFGSAFRYFITAFVILSFVFFSSTWAVGTFVLGGDFKVYPPVNGTALPTVDVLGNVSAVWGKIAQYPVCSLDFSTLDIVDFALIADSVYGYNTSVQFQSFDERFKGTDLDGWQYVQRNNETIDHQVWVELFFPKINMTVVAVRGTASAADALEDLHYWFGISTMQAVNIFVPFLKQLPDKFVVKMLSNDLLGKIMPPPVYTDLLEHVTQLKKRVGDRLVLTGHSLGGAMAGMVGAKTKTPAVSFSGPGLLFTRGRFGIQDADIRDYVLTIKPRGDVVPQVDELGGMVQEIECRRSNPLACHSTQTHLCELYASCGDKRKRDWSSATQCISYLNPEQSFTAMSSTAPLASQHLQRSDVQGALLLAAVAWVSVDLHRMRLHGFRIRGGVAFPPWLPHSALVITVTLVKLYALSRLPLSLAAVVFNATVMIKLAVRSSREHTGDWSWNVASTVLLLCGTVMLAAASTTDQRVTAAMIRDRFSRAAVLQHLLLCSTLMVAIMAWIHETFYAFASGSVSWPRQLSRLVFEELRKHDHPSAIRAYAFAVLSGLAAGCAVLSEKCLAEILRTSDGLVSTPTLSLLTLLASAWLVLTLLEAYWWHHAVIIDASQRELLLRHYLLVWMTVAIVEGVVFFDEIDRHRLFTASLGLIAVYVSSAIFDLRPPIEPKYDDNEAADPSPHLLDATECLLDADEPLASAATATDAAVDLEPPPAYRPPAHFRVV